jgi:hypothetical protein
MLQPSVSRPFTLSVKPPFGAQDEIFLTVKTAASLLIWGAPSNKSTSLSFTIAACPRQRSHSWVRISWDSWPYFTVSDLRLPQPWGPGARIYIPQEQGNPVIPPGTGFPFHRLQRLAGLRLRYSNPPPHGLLKCIAIRTAVIKLVKLFSQHGYNWYTISAVA